MQGHHKNLMESATAGPLSTCIEKGTENKNRLCVWRQNWQTRDMMPTSSFLKLYANKIPSKTTSTNTQVVTPVLLHQSPLFWEDLPLDGRTWLLGLASKDQRDYAFFTLNPLQKGCGLSLRESPGCYPWSSFH